MSKQKATRRHRHYRFSTRLVVLAAIALSTLVTASLVIGLQYTLSRDHAEKVAVEHFKTAAQNTGAYISAFEQSIGQTLRLLASNPLLEENDNTALRRIFADVLASRPMFYGLYIGYPNGDFFELVKLNDKTRASFAQANSATRWVMVEIHDQTGKRQRHLSFYDASFKLQSSLDKPTRYDPRIRNWFIEAKPGAVRHSKPYTFFQNRLQGQTFSIRLANSGRVLALDITRHAISSYLKQQLPDYVESYLYSRAGKVLAASLLSEEDSDSAAASNTQQPAHISLTPEEKNYLKQHPVLFVSNEQAWQPVDFTIAGEPQGYAIDLIRQLVSLLGVEVKFINGYSWPQLVALYQQGQIDILQPVLGNEANRQLGIMTQAIIELPYALVQAEGSAKITRLNQLAGKTIALPAGWSLQTLVERYYPKINIMEVANTYAALQAVATGKAVATMDAKAILRFTAKKYFMHGLTLDDQISFTKHPWPSSYHLVVKKQDATLASLLNKALAQLPDNYRASLKRKWFALDQANSLSVVPYQPLLAARQDPRLLGSLTPTQLNGEDYFVYIDRLKDGGDEDTYFAVAVPREALLAATVKQLQRSLVFAFISLLILLPFCWLFAYPIAASIARLHDESAKIKRRQFTQVNYTPSRIRELDNLSRSLADTAQEVSRYQQAQRDLMEAIIQIIADSIDKKSPYTGGHCSRVPQLGLMLAQAAHDQQQGPLADFAFRNDDEWQEFRLAAWLHDCGKILVPEHVVDKGCKLETVYNRIHEVRMRFEVLWRDAEIDYLQTLCEQPDKQAELSRQRDARQQQLSDDFAFVAQANLGGEAFSDADKQRLQRIGQQQWKRHFSDRLGLAPEEQLRSERLGEEAQLPTTESLLADKPQHIIPHYRPITYDPAYGIRLQPPEVAYNLGELYNLCIERGTLTPEERFKIQEHIIGTITMLEQLPFPPELARAPRYASTHHETLDGRGYPRQLTGDELAVADRILAIADIFEALTASDRPYKQPNTLSEAIGIMTRMVEEQHIDGELFTLFLQSGVYLDYARKFLKDEQIDAVDIDRVCHKLNSTS